MSRRPTPTEDPSLGPIRADCLYTLEQATAALGLRKHALRRQIRQGKLRRARRLGKYLILGQWLLDWLGEGQFSAPQARRPAPNEEVA